MRLLRLKRIAARLTQFDLAQLTHICPSRVSMLERGIVEPTEQEREAIWKVFGGDATVLFSKVDAATV